MKKILVPVDFSEASSWGFFYAYGFALEFDCSIVVVNLYTPPYIESNMPIEAINSAISIKEDRILQDLKANTKKPLLYENEEKTIEISYILESGPSTNIAEIAREQDVDIIIMGTHGAGKALNRIWGSHTSQVVATAHCPVLAIPLGTEYMSMKGGIAYATDFDKDDIFYIQELYKIAKLISAKVHCVHIVKVGSVLNERKKLKFEEDFEKSFSTLPITFNMWSANTVEEGLNIFLSINKISVLAMLKHRRISIWERIFTPKSMTRAMVLQSPIPLLAYHTESPI